MADETTREPFADASDEAPGAEPSGLPDHEFDADRAAGAGVMGSGGTAEDRGTGMAGGSVGDDADVLDGGIAAGTQAGQTTPYIPADPGDADRERLLEGNDLLLDDEETRREP
jgi:hypothetical protein